MKDLGTLGGTGSVATAINEAGKVVGTSDIEPPPFGYHAFLYEDGQGMTDLGTLGGDLSQANDINDTDKVVGVSTSSQDRAFLYSEGVMRDLGTLGGCCSQAHSINNADTVVGASFTTFGTHEEHAFLYSSGQGMTDLGTLPGRTSSVASGINNADQVVGISKLDEGGTHPFLYSGGVMRDLNTLIPPNSGWELIGALKINDNGHIVGFGFNKDGEEHAFLLVKPGNGLGLEEPR
jgi:probable HAF family extracellular repeat protein